MPDNVPATNIAAPAPHYGITEDAFPGTLFTTSDRQLRIAVYRDFQGCAAWHVQKRASATTDRSTWTTQFTARGVVGLTRGLGSLMTSDAALAAFVANLPDRPSA